MGFVKSAWVLTAMLSASQAMGQVVFYEHDNFKVTGPLCLVQV